MQIYDYTILINTQTLQYPITFYQVRMLYSQISFPVPISEEMLEPFPYSPVRETEKPSGDFVVTEAAPEKRDDGLWYQVWEVRDYTEEEYRWEMSLRKTQLRLNAQTIFTDNLDTGIKVNSSGRDIYFKIRPFDITNYLALKSLSLIDENKSFNLKTRDDYIKGIGAIDLNSLLDSIIDRYSTVLDLYWSFLHDVESSKYFSELPTIPKSFLVEE